MSWSRSTAGSSPTRSLPLSQVVPAAIDLGRIDPHVADEPSPAVVDAAVAEMEALYDAAQLLRSVDDQAAPGAVTVRIRSLVRSGRYRLVGP